MSFKGKDIISVNDLSKEELLCLLDIAEDFEKNSKPGMLEGKILATLFFEPSTRTMLSFASAMKQLGGEVIGFSDASATSVQKGETLWDTIKVTGNYADLIAIRHSLEGSAKLAAEATSTPVINCGDGCNQHPTQAMVDLYTIKKLKSRFENLNIGFIGDLRYSRTIHSLVLALSHFHPNLYFIAPQELQIRQNYLEDLTEKGVRYHKTNEFAEFKHFSRELDILYRTRLQKERFPDPQEFEKCQDIFRIDENFLQYLGKTTKVMHPLPRVGEIDNKVDSTSYAAYFDQAANAIPVRKALLALVLGAI